MYYDGKNKFFIDNGGAIVSKENNEWLKDLIDNKGYHYIKINSIKPEMKTTLSDSFLGDVISLCPGFLRFN